MGSAASIRTNGHNPYKKALTPEQQKIQALEARINRLESEIDIQKKLRLSLWRTSSHVRADRPIKGASPAILVCCAFDVPTSCFTTIWLVNGGLTASECNCVVSCAVCSEKAGIRSRALMSMMRELGHQIGRFKVCSLMKAGGGYPNNRGLIVIRFPAMNDLIFPICWHVNLMSKKPKNQKTKKPKNQKTSNHNKVWCGDITYVWAGERWYYLAAVIDLHTRRVVGRAMSDKPDAELAITAFEMAYLQ
jgi:hypothetical protein